MRNYKEYIDREEYQQVITDHYEESLFDRCPHIIRKRVGDESYDICDLNTKSCLIEHGLYECETWNKIQEEGK